MDRKYVLRILGNGMKITVGDTHFIAFRAPTLMLRLGAAHRSQIPLLAQHAAQHTILTFRLDWEETELWESPPFGARVTWGPDEQGQFELTLVEKVDLSGLQKFRK
jgi:hypothetical protein